MKQVNGSILIKTYRKPYKINEEETIKLGSRLSKMGLFPAKFGWMIYVTDTQRGRTRYSANDITVPLWAVILCPTAEHIHKNDPEYAIYYACHELAHAVTPGSGVHDLKFMEAFKELCPEHLWHYELGYKPRAAKAAGIKNVRR